MCVPFCCCCEFFELHQISYTRGISETNSLDSFIMYSYVYAPLLLPLPLPLAAVCCARTNAKCTETDNNFCTTCALQNVVVQCEMGFSLHITSELEARVSVGTHIHTQSNRERTLQRRRRRQSKAQSNDFYQCISSHRRREQPMI